jgi:hypothetical protein
MAAAIAASLPMPVIVFMLVVMLSMVVAIGFAFLGQLATKQ